MGRLSTLRGRDGGGVTASRMMASCVARVGIGVLHVGVGRWGDL